MSDLQWYLIHCKNRQEKVAEFTLHQLGVENFCPRIEKVPLNRSKVRGEGEALFPGYLFIKVDMAREYRKIAYAHGVQRVVKFGASPAVVEEGIINSIRERVRMGLLVPPNQSSLKKSENSIKFGQIIRIKRGPLLGLEAIFEQELNGAQRVALLLKAVAFQGRVIMERNCVGLQ